jgi:hypothetical protein
MILPRLICGTGHALPTRPGPASGALAAPCCRFGSTETAERHPGIDSSELGDYGGKPSRHGVKIVDQDRLSSQPAIKRAARRGDRSCQTLVIRNYARCD